MSNVQKISVSLPEEMMTIMKDVVATGAYASTSEIVRDALRDWQEKQVERDIVIKKYRKMVDDALESGSLLDYSMDDIVQRGRERHKETYKKSA
jgi:antitoxin ParD1/3/4